MRLVVVASQLAMQFFHEYYEILLLRSPLPSMFKQYLTLLSDVLAKKSHKKTHHEKSHGSKIVGGHDADIKDCPYQAYLLVDQGEGDLGNYYECGGSILNNRYILSAAHCFKE